MMQQNRLDNLTPEEAKDAQELREAMLDLNQDHRMRSREEATRLDACEVVLNAKVDIIKKHHKPRLVKIVAEAFKQSFAPKDIEKIKRRVERQLKKRQQV